MTESILLALGGGALIGLAASALLFFSGRICGISGILGGLIARPTDNPAWRMTFVSGLLVGGVVVFSMSPSMIQAASGRSLGMLVVAGLLVGFGTQLGRGCTSGHGVCGITRLSQRSLVATLTFIATGAATATALGSGLLPW